MMTESWHGLSTAGCPSISRIPTAKRSFDIAFLTGVTEENRRNDPSKTQSDLKLSSVSTQQSASSSEKRHGNVNGEGTETKHSSAFTKVSSNSQMFVNSSPSSSGLNDEKYVSPMWAQTQEISSFNLLAGAKGLHPLMRNPFIPSTISPLLSPTNCQPEKFSTNFVEAYLKSQQQGLNSTSSSADEMSSEPKEVLSRLQTSLIPPSENFKLTFGGLPYPLSLQTAKLPTQFLQQSQVPPLVPASLSTLNLPGQNVCAKCNISFRMTSDLVYHMRSQHKKEEDPVKKRRNEKLKCPICAESFRERHHLTRHMTAHQDRKEELESNN